MQLGPHIEPELMHTRCGFFFPLPCRHASKLTYLLRSARPPSPPPSMLGPALVRLTECAVQGLLPPLLQCQAQLSWSLQPRLEESLVEIDRLCSARPHPPLLIVGLCALDPDGPAWQSGLCTSLPPSALALHVPPHTPLTRRRTRRGSASARRGSVSASAGA